MLSVFYSFTGNITNMVVPPADSIMRPSWTIPVENMIGGISGNVGSILTPGLASIDPYCEHVFSCLRILKNPFAHRKLASRSND
jgi:hypothetical protein